jgi:hypothetical protein
MASQAKRSARFASVQLEGNEELFTAWAYRRSLWRTVLFYLSNFVAVGIPFVFSHWRPDWAVEWRRKRCSLKEADSVFIKVN